MKDLLDKLKCDGLVEKDKIGSSCYWWSFDSKLLNMKQNKIDKLKKEIEEVEHEWNIIQPELDKIPPKEDLADWDQEIPELHEMENQLHVLKKEYNFAFCERCERDI